MLRRPGCVRRAVGARGAGAAPGRGARPPPHRRETSRSRSPERIGVPAGGTGRPAGFIRRTLQAADEDNLPFLASALTFDALLAAVPLVLLLLIGLTYLAQALARAAPRWTRPPCSTASSRRTSLPPAATRSALVETLLVRIAENRGRSRSTPSRRSSGSAPASSPAIRTALNEIYDVSARPGRRTGISCCTCCSASCATSAMVIATVILFLANTALTTGLSLMAGPGRGPRHRAAPVLRLHPRTAVRRAARLRLLGLALLRHLPLRLAAPAAVEDGAAGLDLHRGAVRAGQAALRAVPRELRVVRGTRVGDANIGAAVLLILWVYYTCVVFLLGGVVAETWELRKMLRRQRADLG